MCPTTNRNAATQQLLALAFHALLDMLQYVRKWGQSLQQSLTKEKLSFIL